MRNSAECVALADEVLANLVDESRLDYILDILRGVISHPFLSRKEAIRFIDRLRYELELIPLPPESSMGV